MNVFPAPPFPVAFLSSVWGGLWLVLRVMASGFCWAWLPERGRASGPRMHGLFLAAFCAVAGTAVSGLTAVALGECGAFSPVFEGAAAATLMGCGLWLGARRFPGWWRPAFFRVLPWLLGAMAGGAVLLALPDKGEWIVGGWDPGVYMNAGLSLARTGTFHPQDSAFDRRLVPAEQNVFLRRAGTRVERFPGVMAAGGALRFHFFRLTQGLSAVAARSAGWAGAFGLNRLLGAVALLCLAAWVGGLFHGRAAAAALLLLATQPLWVYHTHTPVSEMPELALLCGLCLATALQPGRRRAAFECLLLLALTVNRFSFVPFAGLWLAARAWMDLPREDRAAVLRERVCAVAAVCLGAVCDLVTSPASVLGWTVWPLLVVLGGCGMAAALAVDRFGLPRRGLETARWLVSAAGVAVALLALRPVWQPGCAQSENWIQWACFTGWPLVGLAVAGAGCVAFAPRALPRPFKAVLFFWAGMTLALWADKSIVNVYPWALRRYLSSGAPLAALLGVCALLGLERAGTRGRRWAAALLGCVVLAQGPAAMRAVACAEYAGVTGLLDGVAARVRESDWLVADHFRWGTPLRCVWGRTVLNGERLLPRKAGPGRAAEGFDALARLARGGADVWLLTSTANGAAVFGEAARGFVLQEDFGPAELPEIVHHRHMRGFQSRPCEVHFRLYRFSVPPDSNGSKM